MEEQLMKRDHRCVLVLSALLVCLAFADNASAQRRRELRQPHAGSSAIGADIGVFVPSDERLEPAPPASGYYEYYFTPRISIRPEIGWADPGFDRSTVSLRQLPVRVGLNYNWEGGRWHPFVGAGVGAYLLQVKDAGRPFGGAETRPGFSAGGGIEYFLNGHVSLKGEGRIHSVEKLSNGDDPSGVGLMFGVKRYF